MLLSASALWAQTVQITGTVTSAEDGMPVIGATVTIKGTTIGTVTDVDGRYLLNAPANATTLVCSFVGMRTQEIEIQGRTNIPIALQVDALDLDEIVVVGYGVQRKRDVTGSISQVKGDELANLAAPSFDALLSGRSSGVQVTSNSGVLGQAPRIRVRGIGSISQETFPLVVVDGIPIFTGDMGGYADNNALGDINPADIESIEILKDGSATAIYGSRAANGVMLITTKKGTRGKFKLSYSNYFGVASPVNLFDLLNAEQFITIANEKRTNLGLSPLAETLTTYEKVETDWQRAVLRENAFQQDHSMSLSGATDVTNYYFSLGYSAQDGVTRPNDMSRFTLRANVDQKIKSWLKVGINTGLTKSKYSGLNTGANSLSGNIFNAIRQLPNTPVYNPDHPTGYNISNDNKVVGQWNNAQSADDNISNIVYALDHNIFRTSTFRTIANAYALVDILPYLNFKTQVGVDHADTEGFRYYNPIHGDGNSYNGRINNNFRNHTRWNLQNVLSFNKSFADVHNVNAILVNELQGEQNKFFTAMGTDISHPFFRHNVTTGTIGTEYVLGGFTDKGFISYAGRVNYNYDSKYFFQASIRRDGISDLPLKNRYGLFPGVSVGWTISQEEFMSTVSFITDLKIRASYAEVGNVGIGDYPYLGLYSSAKYADYNGIGFDQMGNPDLMWETSKKTNLGLDAAFAGGKYRVSFDYFVNDQDGLILAVPTPPSLGVPGNAINTNIGRSKNTGYEFFAEAALIRTKDISLVVDANLTFMKNEITELVGGNPILETYTIIAEGESFRSIYGYEYAGVNTANGNPMYYKADGTIIQGDIDSGNYYIYNASNPTDLSVASALETSDRKIFGPSLPTYFGAFNTRLRYKDFDFGVMLRFSGGNYIMNETRSDLTNQKFQNNSTEILGRWQSPSNPGDGWTPRLAYNKDNFVNLRGITNSRYIEKGDFLKIQNISFGYTLPADLTSRIGVEGLRVFGQLQDYFMITNYKGIDPEQETDGFDHNGTPRQRVMTFGLSLTL